MSLNQAENQSMAVKRSSGLIYASETNARESTQILRTDYGCIELLRAFCPDCRAISIVDQDSLSCCGLRIDLDQAQIGKKRAVESRSHRIRLGEKSRKELLEENDYKCIYCRQGLALEDTHIDHFIPFSYSGDNRRANLYSCCEWCNVHKKDLIFPTVEDVREYLSSLKGSPCQSQIDQSGSAEPARKSLKPGEIGRFFALPNVGPNTMTSFANGRKKKSEQISRLNRPRRIFKLSLRKRNELTRIHIEQKLRRREARRFMRHRHTGNVAIGVCH